MTDRRLLILDDDPQIGQTIQFIAEGVSLESIATQEPEEFFRLLTDWQPTHIALDLVMPQMDGVEVIAELAQRQCKAQIIITSGVGSRILDAAGRSAAEHGLNIIGVLSKPFSPSTLRTMLTSTETIKPAVHLPSALSRFKATIPELEEAIANQQLVMAYQPKIECATGKLSGFEALVRWDHPQHGIIMPDNFVPFAEENGLISGLTDAVLEQSLRWFTSFQRDREVGLSLGNAAVDMSAITLSINLSARSLHETELADRMARVCQHTGIDTRQVIFEVTETSAMEDPVISLDLLTRLRMKGFNLSIDDFGTGFSSMIQLVRLPFSEIKVDKSFVMNAMESKESRTVISSIVDLGQSLGLKVTAEGVENSNTLEFLMEQGCDLAQGYHIARPMWGENIVAWIKDRSA
ncbi:MAG: hypothetical protein VR73_15285 [Gammaproteobacteria bacterium BRH_c0]|nr:MAG: hypothetical protein VR73_15285 [Gammaproteobacteria bacterium BRH_c0]